MIIELTSEEILKHWELVQRLDNNHSTHDMLLLYSSLVKALERRGITDVYLQNMVKQ